MNTQQLTDVQLIEELRKRGYVTAFLLSNDDVDVNLEVVNDAMEDGEPVVLTDSDKEDILSSIVQTHADHICALINDAIVELIESDYTEQ